jgi:hypothetical protein
MTNVPRWYAKGDWFDVCKCNIPCPCEFAQAPTFGDCEAMAEALTGPTTLPGQLVQTFNPPGSEVGPNAVATWATAKVDRVDSFGFKWNRSGQSSKHIPFSWSGPD